MAQESVTTENGWALYAHPFFTARLIELTSSVKKLIEKDPTGFHHHPLYHLYESVMEQVTRHVPADPMHRDFRQGSTLGPKHQHWFRVKKGMPQRYRLFFQFRSTAPKTIIYAWFNDEDTVRKAGAKTDVYETFKAMLKGGKMPDKFDDLLSACEQNWVGAAGLASGSDE